MEILGIDHVQLAAPAGCEEAARAFFGGVLGLDEVAKPEGVKASGGVWFRVGAQELHIGLQEPFVPALKAHPSLMVPDEATLQAFAERLAAESIDVQWDHRIEGQPRFYFPDPWGNRVELRSAS
jgi:catechol 2,3-dioxygenase-like lactoylglutathione lyase family enzyme